MGFDTHRGLSPKIQPRPYIPTHERYVDSYTGHCCFAGCTPRGCPAGCCVAEMGHRGDCPLNPGTQLREAHAHLYIEGGHCKHLRVE
jgi:hypothetical protein